MSSEEAQKLAEAVRTACLKAARQGYEQASASGLCHEGAVEAALGAVSMLDLKGLLAGFEQGERPG